MDSLELFNQNNNQEKKLENISNPQEQPSFDISNLKKELEEIRKNLEKDLIFVNKLIEVFEKGCFAQILTLKKQKSKQISEINSRISFLTKIPDIVQKISSQSEGKCKEIAKRYPKLLEEKCKSENIPMDKTSRYPKYTFCDNFITLEVNDKNFTAKLSTYGGKLLQSPISFDIPIVAEKLKEEIDKIFNRSNFDPKKFLKNIFISYKKIIKDKKGKLGDAVPIKDVIKEITKQLNKPQKEYRIHEFIIDFSKLQKENVIFSKGKAAYKLTVDQTRDTKEGILLHGYETLGYIGLIRFNKTNKELKHD